MTSLSPMKVYIEALNNTGGPLTNRTRQNVALQNLYADLWLKQSTPVLVVFILSYLLIFLLCLIGNMMVCFAILRIPRMRTVTNYFLMNLAVSDLLVAFFCIPFTLVDNILLGWQFGDVMCRLTPAVQVVSVAASIFTLVAVAIDRFYSVVYPTEPKLTGKSMLKILVAVWVFALVFSVPQTLLMEDKHESFEGELFLHTCKENAPDWRQAYTVCLFLFCYVGPLGVVVFLYARIGYAVWSKPTPGGDTAPNEVKQVSLKKKLKVIKMLLIVVVMFAFLWLPLHTIFMLYDFGNLDKQQRDMVDVYIYPVAHWMSYLSSSLNPIIYGYYNENFRTAYKSMCNSDVSIRVHDLGTRSPRSCRSHGGEEQVELKTFTVIGDRLAPPPRPIPQHSPRVSSAGSTQQVTVSVHHSSDTEA
ncbi:PREDICTED: neuropeptide FF receptor 2-like [Branchiostoma belcheri]|uniref:Neuropeptide FF receptor 1 n=1 Tax=Branchiostoma belcheri TaxID=7741 RepID=A0A6P4Z106_BRABE|nr:PREDICTED: neuropeptide FF receptor 2-like [Branchiostoma belcheri]